MKNFLIFLLLLSCKVKEGSYSSDDKLCLEPQACYDEYASCDQQTVWGGQEEGSHFLTFATTNAYSAQQFSLAKDNLIYSISVGIAQSSSPSGKAYVELRESCYDNAENLIPCEAAIARSAGLDMDTFSITTPIENQEFIFDEPIRLYKNKNYWIVVHYPLKGQTGKQIFQYAKSGDPLPDFKYLMKTEDDANWNAGWVTYDMVFLINECQPGLD
jgi:hypothetical protein